MKQISIKSTMLPQAMGIHKGNGANLKLIETMTSLK